MIPKIARVRSGKVNNFAVSKPYQPLFKVADAPPVPGVPPGVRLRELTDSDALRDEIHGRVKQAYQDRFPIENDRVRLELYDLEYDPKKLQPQGNHAFKKAMLEDGSLRTPLRGTFRLRDRVSNQLLDEKRLAFANVPHLSHRGTFIMNGIEYSTCFHPGVQVWTEEGMVPIGDLVKERRQVRVWSYDFDTQSFELKPIVRWIETKAKENLKCLSFRNSGAFGSRVDCFNPTTLWGTGDHKLITETGEKIALEESTSIAVAKEKLSRAQTQLLYGSLLGDATVCERGLLRFMHCEAQLPYLELKRQIFGSLCDGPVQRNVSRPNRLVKSRNVSFKAWTKTTADIKQARSFCYVAGVKRVNREWLDKLDDLGLAFWFLDDGSVRRQKRGNSGSVTLHTNGFFWEDILTIQQWFLERWNWRSVIEKSSNSENENIGWMIRFHGESAEQLLDTIAPYVPECFLYKLLDRPSTKGCHICGKEITRLQKWCNQCTLDKARQCGDKSLPREARDRFGSTFEVRRLLFSGEIPADRTGCERWEKRFKNAGVNCP